MLTAPSEYLDPATDFGAGVNGVKNYTTTNNNSVDANGVVTEAVGTNITSDGQLIEESSTNLFLNSHAPVTQDITTVASSYTVSVTGTGDITLTGTAVGTATAGNDLTVTATAGTLTCTVNGVVNTAQVENLAYATSLIRTTGSAASRLSESTSMPGPAGLVNDFVIIVDAVLLDKLAYAAVFQMYLGFNDHIILQRQSSSTTAGVTKRVAGVDFQVNVAGAWDGTKKNIRVRISSVSGVDVWFNGVKAAGNANTTDLATGSYTLHLGKNQSGTRPVDSTFKNVKVFKVDPNISDAGVLAL